MALQVTNAFVLKEWLIILVFFMPKFHGINPRTTLLSYHKSCLISYICEFMHAPFAMCFALRVRVTAVQWHFRQKVLSYEPLSA